MGTVWTVVVAGGSGSRFGGEKQFQLLRGKPVVDWSVDVARTASDGVVLVLPLGHDGDAHGADTVVTGGSTRSASVRAGLTAVPDDAELILVHDAARPLAGIELFRAVIGALRQSDAAGIICVLPVADTLKRVANGEIISTVDRDTLVAVQTPQGFRAEALRRAHASGSDATDDAALVETLGLTIGFVDGDPANLKITTPQDLARAQLLAPS